MASPAVAPLLAFAICDMQCYVQLARQCPGLASPPSPPLLMLSLALSVQKHTVWLTTACKSESVAGALAQVIGMAAIQAMTDLSNLQRNFHTVCMSGLTQEEAADKRIVQLTAVCINPIFVHQARQVLLDILRRCKASMMLFLLHPHQTPPEALQVFR